MEGKIHQYLIIFDKKYKWITINIIKKNTFNVVAIMAIIIKAYKT